MANIGVQKTREEELKDAVKQSRSKFDRLWEKIEEYCDENWRTDLRIAANIVGFCLFPIGWSWNECVMKKKGEPPSFRKAAVKIRRDLLSTGVSLGKTTSKAVRCGKNFRLKRVEKRILRMIARAEVRTFLRDRNDDWRGIRDKIRLHKDLAINIETNHLDIYDAGLGTIWTVNIDALDLLDALSKKSQAWKTNENPTNWYKVEGYLRGAFESKGIPRSRETYVTEVSEWYAREVDDTHDLVGSTLRERVSKLYDEYSFYEEQAKKT